MKFKLWLMMSENLAGPGGGPDMEPIDLVAINKNITGHGAGAFPQGGDNPPKAARTATHGYEDSRFSRKPKILYKKRPASK